MTVQHGLIHHKDPFEGTMTFGHISISILSIGMNRKRSTSTLSHTNTNNDTSGDGNAIVLENNTEIQCCEDEKLCERTNDKRGYAASLWSH